MPFWVRLYSVRMRSMFVALASAAAFSRSRGTCFVGVMYRSMAPQKVKATPRMAKKDEA